MKEQDSDRPAPKKGKEWDSSYLSQSTTGREIDKDENELGTHGSTAPAVEPSKAEEASEEKKYGKPTPEDLKTPKAGTSTGD